MNYVVPTNMPFKVSSDFKFRKETSEESRKIKKFIDTHNFSISLDPETGEPIVKVTEITDGQRRGKENLKGNSYKDRSS